MKKVFVFLTIGLFAVVSTAMSGWDGYAPVATAKVTYRVVDQDGKSVEGATVSQCFFNRRDSGQEELLKGLTDTNGVISFEGATSGEVSYRIRKGGYYDSSGSYKKWMEVWRPPSSNIEKGRWQPWNPTFEVVVKEIKNPIPMFAKRVRVDVPVENKPVGFDLEKGDWVSPYGKGLKSDLGFFLERGARSENNFECSLQVTFPNKGDGLQEYVASPVPMGSLKLPHVAPQTGYASVWKRELYSKPDGSRKNLETREDQNYMFRIQTVLDENNKVKSALYGKIHGDINFYGYIADKVTLVFSYYLNPTPNDRNVEFDPDKNLFGGRDRFAP